MISEKNLVNISSQGEDYKFKYLDNLPVYQFKTSEKDYEIKLKNSDFIVRGSNGVEKYKIEEHLWSLRDPSCQR